jgi:hypothetical protein
MFLLFQEVKECAISCMGLVVATFGDNLSTELLACLPVKVGPLHVLEMSFSWVLC